MDPYSAQRLARIEHERMVRSLPTVPEFGAPLVEHKREKKWQRPILWGRAILTALLHIVTK